MEQISPEQINKLLLLSRIEIQGDEKERLASDIEAILGYISQLTAIEAITKEIGEISELQNVFRDDGKPYPRGMFREQLLAAAPSREGNYFKVKKIL